MPTLVPMRSIGSMGATGKSKEVKGTLVKMCRGNNKVDKSDCAV